MSARLPCPRAYRVSARVRREGALGDYYRREFMVMLAEDTSARMAREARRVLRQIGYQTRGDPQLLGPYHPEPPAGPGPSFLQP
jgi:hypothetical protein